MAGDWIKMRADLLTHPKVVRMAASLKVDRLRAVGALYAVWCLFDAHTEDGRLHGYTEDVLNDMVGLKGCAAAMCAVGWLLSDADGLSMPEFCEHNGKSAKVRAEDAKRKRLDRTNVQNIPDKTRTDSGLEKRREEINTLEPNGSCQLGVDLADLPEEAKPEKPGLPSCPHGELLALWKKHLPNLRQPRVWDGNRKVTMRNRWQQAAHPSEYSPDGYGTEEGGLRWWDSFFGYIARDTSLAKGFESAGRTWAPDLEWVCNAANFQKIIDGKYTK